MSALTISAKAIGQRKPLFTNWSIPFPPEWSGEENLTLRDLIDRIVRIEVKAFHERQQDRQVFRMLTAKQIAEGVEKGKVDMGGRESAPQEVDDDEAVGVACQAFVDGMFLVVIDGEDHRELDKQIYLRPESHITFVRLTLLAGG